MSVLYDNYLEQHRANVTKGFNWLQKNIPDVTDKLSGYDYQFQFEHDRSKDSPDEYNAYDAYFYGNNKSYAIVKDFNRAWLMHIHRNPHHWQYWVLINDDPNEGDTILDMDYNYIIEMICDWWAFSWSEGNLHEIFKWYNEHKDYIKLSDATRNTVEYILDRMKRVLDEI